MAQPNPANPPANPPPNPSITICSPADQSNIRTGTFFVHGTLHNVEVKTLRAEIWAPGPDGKPETGEPLHPLNANIEVRNHCHRELPAGTHFFFEISGLPANIWLVLKVYGRAGERYVERNVTIRRRGG